MPLMFESSPHFQQAMLDTFTQGKLKTAGEIPGKTLSSYLFLQLISLFPFNLLFSQRETKKEKQK